MKVCIMLFQSRTFRRKTKKWGKSVQFLLLDTEAFARQCCGQQLLCNISQISWKKTQRVKFHMCSLQLRNCFHENYGNFRNSYYIQKQYFGSMFSTKQLLLKNSQHLQENTFAGRSFQIKFQLANLLRKRFQDTCCPGISAKFLRTSFLQSNSG